MEYARYSLFFLFVSMSMHATSLENDAAHKCQVAANRSPWHIILSSSDDDVVVSQDACTGCRH